MTNTDLVLDFALRSAIHLPIFVVSAYGLWVNKPLVLSNRQMALLIFVPLLAVTLFITTILFSSATGSQKATSVLSVFVWVGMITFGFRDKGFMVLGAS